MFLFLFIVCVFITCEFLNKLFIQNRYFDFIRNYRTQGTYIKRKMAFANAIFNFFEIISRKCISCELFTHRNGCENVTCENDARCETLRL